MRRRWMRIVLVMGALVVPSSAWATSYNIDKDHTTVGFKVRHLFSVVETGQFLVGDEVEVILEVEGLAPAS